MLSLDENHQYKWNDRKVPGVSEIIQSSCLFNGDFYVESGRARGERVHKLLEAYDNGDEVNVLEEDMPYFEAYRRFHAENTVDILEVEARKYQERFKYAGTIDRLILFRGEKAVIDIKTLKEGTPPRWTRLQTAAYAAFYQPPVRRFLLCLRANGSYAFLEHKESIDFNLFVCALNLFNAQSHF